MLPKLGKSLISKLADKAGISVGGHDGSPFPTVDQLKQFALGVVDLAAKSIERSTKKITYCVGYYYANGGVATYTYGRETFTGTMSDAQEFLKYVKSQEPSKDWQIFMLVELPT